MIQFIKTLIDTMSLGQSIKYQMYQGLILMTVTPGRLVMTADVRSTIPPSGFVIFQSNARDGAFGAPPIVIAVHNQAKSALPVSISVRSFRLAKVCFPTPRPSYLPDSDIDVTDGGTV